MRRPPGDQAGSPSLALPSVRSLTVPLEVLTVTIFAPLPAATAATSRRGTASAGTGAGAAGSTARRRQHSDRGRMVRVMGESSGPPAAWRSRNPDEARATPLAANCPYLTPPVTPSPGDT